MISSTKKLSVYTVRVHISEDVKKYDRLDNYSAFKFKNYMQQIKKFVRKNSQPLEQINNRLFEMNKLLRADVKANNN